MAGIAHREKVLVVDDAPDSLRIVTAALEQEGIAVLVANSGRGALEILARIEPDLILMDAIMPVMDGFETTEQIRANPALAHIPVVFMTGLSDGTHVARAFASGGVDYVRKPVDLSELIARVRAQMSRARAVHASVTSLDATGRLVIATDNAANLMWCTPLAERAIGRLDSTWSAGGKTLPSPLREAIERLLVNRPVLGNSSRIDSPHGVLELAIIAHYRDDEVLVRLNEQNPQDDIARLQQRLQVTPREAEVLFWLSYGKSNADISEVLKISPRTVQKHLERIFEKLGVETRSAAATVALRVTGK